jgi:transglycosylase-like protein with SLT domain/FHA domain-containing protein
VRALLYTAHYAMEDSAHDSKAAGWLVRVAGPNVGKRHAVATDSVLIGRDPASDITPYGEESAYVSTRHAQITRDEAGYYITDLESTNGTFVNGTRITDSLLNPHDIVRFGSSGPEYRFETTDGSIDDLSATIVAPRKVPAPAAGDQPSEGHEKIVHEAVEQARRARDAGFGGQTAAIMRDVVDDAVGRSSRRHRRVIWALVAALVVTIGLAYWRISDLKMQKRDIDVQILEIEQQIEEGGLQDSELDELMSRLTGYQQQALKLQDSVFFKLGLEGREVAFVEKEIRNLMAEFGAEQYSIPPEFTEQVSFYVERYRTQDRGVVERSIGSRRDDFQQMKAIFEELKLPPDLVAMVLVESSFLSQRRSHKGAAGLWQFTPSTARAYGLKVNSSVDERHDLEKATAAAGGYVRELILDFGAGSSVMLALAAYNGGPGKVKRAVRRVDDPIKQRNFWYLYRSRALPKETRQYVPKIVAAIIVGRNLDEFGF